MRRAFRTWLRDRDPDLKRHVVRLCQVNTTAGRQKLARLFPSRVASADELKKRYWIRVITPKERGEKGEYWLEAYPKFRRDSANFQKVEIILEKKDFLPAVLTLFSPEHDFVKGRVIAKQTIQ